MQRDIISSKNGKMVSTPVKQASAPKPAMPTPVVTKPKKTASKHALAALDE